MSQNDFWNKLKQRLRDVSTAAADFTEEQATIGKLKFDILNLKRRIDRCQREIGERVCELAQLSPSADALKDREIKGKIAEIRDLEKQVERKRVDISKVTEDYHGRDRKRPAGATTQAAPKSKPASKSKSTGGKRGRPKGSKSKTVKKNPAEGTETT